MQMTAAHFWQALQDALAAPQRANLKRLCEQLDWLLAQLPQEQHLSAGGEAIQQLAEIHALRFHLLLSLWEEADPFSEPALPVIDLDALEGWVRQSMSVNLDLLVEQPTVKRPRQAQPSAPEDSIAGIVERAAVLEMVEQIEAEDQHQLIRQLAGEEDPARWSAVIARWMQEYAPNQRVSFSGLQQSLKMPWVEVWMGLLLDSEFSLEQRGDFYSSDIWVNYEPLSFCQ